MARFCHGPISIHLTCLIQALFAIQELLKCANVTVKTPKLYENAKADIAHGAAKIRNCADLRVWDSLGEEVCLLATPCLSSTYFIPEKKSSVDSSHRILYSPGISHSKWLSAWARALIQRCKSELREIFAALRSVVLTDTVTCAFVLPFLVLDCLAHGSDAEVKLISQEILALLDDSNRQSALSVQFVFEVLDGLSQRQLSSLKISGVRKETEMLELHIQPRRLGDILDSIPKLLLAEAAYSCRAHTRALLYFEGHVRDLQSSKSCRHLTSSELDLMQKILVGLADVDPECVRIVMALRHEPATASERARYIAITITIPSPSQSPSPFLAS